MDTKPDLSSLEPTIDYHHPSGFGTRSEVPSRPITGTGGGGAKPRVGIVAGSGVHLSEETRSLLQVRLRAVALTMSCAFGAFLVRDIGLSGHSRDPILRGLHIVVEVAFLASFALQGVLAAASAERVVAGAALDRLGSFPTQQGVRAIRADHRLDAFEGEVRAVADA